MHILKLLAVVFSLITFSAEAQPKPLKIGFLGSLTGFAGSYGTAVLEGAKLAAKELEAQGHKIELLVEDDQSVTNRTVTAFSKLADLDKVSGVIGGTWWVNAVAKRAEQQGVPLLSCETLFNKETVSASTYFILQGDLREWVRVYEPVFQKYDRKRGAIVRYTSGFGETLAEEMQTLFSKAGRTFAGAVEYNDVQLTDAASVVFKLRKLQPDVVYIDAQPGGLINILKKLEEANMTDLHIVTNSIGDDVLRAGSYELGKFKTVHFTKRESYDAEFQGAFLKEYGRQPILNTDLGYYALRLLQQALAQAEPLSFLKQGVVVQGKTFSFNERNVSSGIAQQVFEVRGKEAVRFIP